MDGAATITELIKEVTDFIGEILVFALDDIELFNGFFMGSAETEEFAVVVAGFLVAGVDLSTEIISLGLPFGNDLLQNSEFSKLYKIIK